MHSNSWQMVDNRRYETYSISKMAGRSEEWYRLDLDCEWHPFEYRVFVPQQV